MKKEIYFVDKVYRTPNRKEYGDMYWTFDFAPETIVDSKEEAIEIAKGQIENEIDNGCYFGTEDDVPIFEIRKKLYDKDDIFTTADSECVYKIAVTCFAHEFLRSQYGLIADETVLVL